MFSSATQKKEKKEKEKNSRAPEQHSDIEAASYEFR